MIYKEVWIGDYVLTRGFFGWWVHVMGVPHIHFWFFKNAKKWVRSEQYAKSQTGD